VNTLQQLEAVEHARTCRLRDRSEGCELCEAAEAAGKPELRSRADAALVLGAGERICLKVASRPFNNGHLLAFPRRHVASLPSLSAEELAELAVWLQRAESLLRQAYSMDALNVGANSGTGGHLAFHLIPRWGGDLNFLPLVAGLKLVPESPQGSWERLCRAMG